MKKILSLTAVLVLCTAMLAGCGGGFNAMTAMKADSAYSESFTAPMANDYGYSDYELYDYGDSYAEAPLDEYYDGSDSYYVASTSETADSDTAQSVEESAPAESGRKLIKTVNMNIETLTFDDSCSIIERYVNTLGGYIENSSVEQHSSYYYNTSYRANRYGTYVVRIPGEKLDLFLDTIGNIGSITNQSMSTEDVTLSYLDVEARAKSLKIQQERLLALLEKAETVDEIISLENRISQVTYELEAKESLLKNYDNLVAFSTVYIYLTEVEHVTQPVVEPQTVGERISAGLKETFYDIGEGFKDFAVDFVVNLPFILIWLAVIAIIVFVIVLIVKLCKKLHTKRQAKKQAKLQAKLQAQWAAKKASAQNNAQTTEIEKNE